MKKERQFLNDLYRRTLYIIPFIELFQKNKELKKELFQQYLKTDIKPEFSLFLNSHYSDQELEAGFELAHNNIPVINFGMASFIPQTDFENSIKDLEKEFYTLSTKKEIAEKFCKHSISETPIIKKLQEIDTLIKDFDLYVTKKTNYSPKEYAEAFAKQVIHRLKTINNCVLTELILIEFIEKEKRNENRFDYLFDHSYNADAAKANYREIAMYANNFISDYLQALPTHPNIDVTKEQLLKKDNKLIPNISIAEVFNHFEILTKTTNKDKIVYLTEKQLLTFVKTVFIDKEPLQQKFNCIVYSKKDVRSVFYRFYKESTIFENKHTGLKQKYFDIMDKSFPGFNETDLNEFNKTNNTIAS